MRGGARGDGVSTEHAVIPPFHGASAGLKIPAPVRRPSTTPVAAHPAWERAETGHQTPARSRPPCCVAHGGKPCHRLAQAPWRQPACQGWAPPPLVPMRWPAVLRRALGYLPLCAVTPGCGLPTGLRMRQPWARHAWACSPMPSTSLEPNTCTTSYQQPYTEINNVANYRTVPANGQSPKLVNIYYGCPGRCRLLASPLVPQ